MEIKQSVAKEVPVFEFKDFTMYELNTESLTMIMKGFQASKYQDRYDVQDINYTDNTQQNRANMLASHGVYKDDIIYLDGDVLYKSLNKNRFTFHTTTAKFEKKKSLITCENNFTITFENGMMRGTYLQYNNAQQKVYSKNVTANYNLY
jgi:hypothetical protein